MQKALAMDKEEKWLGQKALVFGCQQDLLTAAGMVPGSRRQGSTAGLQDRLKTG